jgi:hypothetical protein
VEVKDKDEGKQKVGVKSREINNKNKNKAAEENSKWKINIDFYGTGKLWIYPFYKSFD